MRAVAGDFYALPAVFAALAAVILVIRHSANTRGMRTLFRFSGIHFGNAFRSRHIRRLTQSALHAGVQRAGATVICGSDTESPKSKSFSTLSGSDAHRCPCVGCHRQRHGFLVRRITSGWFRATS
jgi:hypothetical protein